MECFRTETQHTSSKRPRAPALQTWPTEQLFWSASGLPELWIAPERELVGNGSEDVFPSVRLPNGRERQHSKLGRRGSYFGVLPACRSFGSRRNGNSWEVGARTCSRACVIHSGRKRQHSKLGRRSSYFGVLPACRSFGSRRNGNSWEVGARTCSRACVIHSGRKR